MAATVIKVRNRRISFDYIVVIWFLPGSDNQASTPDVLQQLICDRCQMLVPPACQNVVTFCLGDTRGGGAFWVNFLVIAEILLLFQKKLF